MGAFLYGISLQWRLDLRSRTLLITCYIVPLLFFPVMGGIFTSVMPGAGETLVQSMTVFGVTMGALIGLPPSLVEIYGGDIKKVYRANGVPLWLGLALTNLSAFLHLLLMSGILYIAAPLAFRAVLPEDSVRYFLCLALFLAVTLGDASVIGLAVKDQAKTSVVSIAVFLPSILLSGIMFPVELLPGVLEMVGRAFPAAWGYRLLSDQVFQVEGLLPLLAMLLLAAVLCGVLLRRVGE